jgi:hypothetical protein
MKHYFKYGYDYRLIVTDANKLIAIGMTKSRAFKTVWRVAKKQKLAHLSASLERTKFMINEHTLDYRAMRMFMYREHGLSITEINSGCGIVRNNEGNVTAFVRRGHRALKNNADMYLINTDEDMNTFKFHHKNKEIDFIDIIQKTKTNESIFA